MWIVVTGLMMLAGAVVREQGQTIDDLGWRRGGEQQSAAWNGNDRGGGTAVTVIAGPPVGTMSMGGGEADALMSTAQSQVEGEWDLACESKRGNHMVFDRESIREIGNATLFRWAAADRAPVSEDAVYTAVADCSAKSIEAHWPGKRTATRAGTCGRHLVDAVCAARAQAQAR
jgi:hypothetical protein